MTNRIVTKRSKKTGTIRRQLEAEEIALCSKQT